MMDAILAGSGALLIVFLIRKLNWLGK